MATAKALTLKERVDILEAEVARLKAQLGTEQKPRGDWLADVWRAFAGDPALLEAMRYGREWRESFRPKPRRKRKVKR